MNARVGRWIGRDLHPLPYESSLNIVWRFAWCNSLGHSQLLPYIGKNWRDRSILHAAQRAQSVMGWNKLCDLEEVLYERFPRDVDVWIERRFRYCPLCLEHGYHSIFHQLIPQSHCPVHQVELSTRCYACGEPLPRYERSRTLLTKPYHCPACGSPISGVTPDLALHLAFRQAEAQLVEAFRPLETWWRKNETIRQEVAQFSSSNDSFGHTWPGDWCDRDAFVRDLCRGLTPTPPEFAGRRYHCITIFDYRLTSRRALVWDPIYPDNWRYDVARAETVYRATLRFLEKWLTQYDPISPAEYARHAAFEVINGDHGKCINIQGYQPRLFALILLRWQLECGFGSSRLLPARQAQLCRAPFLDQYEVRRDTPRLTWRALFLGMYVAWYYRVKAARQRGRALNLANLAPWNAAHVFSHYSRWRDEVWQETVYGRLAFPSVEGLDGLLRGRTRHTTQLIGDQHPPFVESPRQAVAARASDADTKPRVKNTVVASAFGNFGTAPACQPEPMTRPLPKAWENCQLELPFGDGE